MLLKRIEDLKQSYKQDHNNNANRASQPECLNVYIINKKQQKNDKSNKVKPDFPPLNLHYNFFRQLPFSPLKEPTCQITRYAIYFSLIYDIRPKNLRIEFIKLWSFLP